MANIKDVAQRAGVSVSTVSNILNNKETVSDGAYAAVMDAMKALNYRPSLLARSLKSNKVKFIGMIVPALGGIYKDIMDGIQREMEADEYYIIVKTTDNFPTREKRALDAFMNLGVQGVFLVTSYEKNAGQYEDICNAHIPLIFVERTFEERAYTSVVFDNRSVVRKLFTTLLETYAPEDILLITGAEQFSAERDCVTGAEMALPDPSLLNRLCVSLGEVQSYSELTRHFFDRDAIPRVIVLSCDRILDSLLEMLHMYGHDGIEIYVLTGDKWHHHYAPGVHFVKRSGIRCGKECAKLMRKYMDRPILYEDTQLVVSANSTLRRENALPAGSKDVLRLLLAASPSTDAIRQMIPGFTRRTGVEVLVQEFDFQRDLYDAILSQKAGDPDRADIMMVDYPWVDALSARKRLYPLDAFLADDPAYVDGFLPQAWNAFMPDAGDKCRYGIPLALSNQLMLYRKDLLEDPQLQRLFFKQYGIRLRVPQTWAEFNFVAKFFTRTYNEASPTEYGTCILGASPYGLVQEFLPRQWNNNGRIADKRGIVIDSVQNLRALSSLRDTYAYSYPDIQNFMENEQICQFAQGNIAAINTYDCHIKSIFHEQFSGIADSIGFAPIPGTVSLLGAWMLSLSAFSPNRDMGVAFLKWLTSDEVAIHSSIVGGAMPKRLVNENEQLKTIYPWFERHDDYMEQTRKREVLRDIAGRVVSVEDIDRIIAQSVHRVLFDGVELEAGLAEMKASFCKLTGR